MTDVVLAADQGPEPDDGLPAAVGEQDDARDSLALLRDEMRRAWAALESQGFPPEAAGWPFIHPDLGGAVTAALDCMARQRNDLVEEVEFLRRCRKRAWRRRQRQPR